MNKLILAEKPSTAKILVHVGVRERKYRAKTAGHTAFTAITITL